MLTRLGQTRTVVTQAYALMATDSHVASVLPGWSRCTPIVVISAAMGAQFSQYHITLEPDGRGEGETGEDSWFFYVVDGTVAINGKMLSRGGFAYVPPGDRYAVHGAGSAGSGDTADAREPGKSTVLVFRKPYEPLGSHAAPSFLTGQESEIAEAPFLGDPRARLKTLLPDHPSADMAVNIFTYDPGATLPFVETHVMEHGMLFLAGGGVYKLDEDWHPVTAGDAIWIGPYCPQWFIAAGPEPARYIYYKDVNRLPE